MTVAGQYRLRAAIAKESSFKSPGSYVNARGLMRDSVPTAGRETLAIENALNSKGDRYGAIEGMQQYTCALNYYLHAGWYTDLADVFQAALGAKSTTTSPTFSSSADNFTITTTGNVADSIVKLTGSDSKTYIVPVDVANAGTNTLGVGLPTGTTATAIKNPGSCGGATFSYSDGGAANTFSIETDWSAQPTSSTQENVLALGCALTSFVLVWARDKPWTIQTKWVGAQYTEGGGAGANTSDPTAWTAEGPGWTWDWFLQKVSATTAWGDTTPTPLKNLTVELTPPLITETGAIGLSGGSNNSSVLAGSDTTGYTRDAALESLLTVRVPWSATYLTDFTSGLPFRLFGVGYPGSPGVGAVSSVIRNALYFRRLVPVGRPVSVVDAGGRYADLSFQIERDRTSNTNVERVHIARFNS